MYTRPAFSSEVIDVIYHDIDQYLADDTGQYATTSSKDYKKAQEVVAFALGTEPLVIHDSEWLETAVLQHIATISPAALHILDSINVDGRAIHEFSSKNVFFYYRHDRLLETSSLIQKTLSSLYHGGFECGIRSIRWHDGVQAPGLCLFFHKDLFFNQILKNMVNSFKIYHALSAEDKKEVKEEKDEKKDERKSFSARDSVSLTALIAGKTRSLAAALLSAPEERKTSGPERKR